MVAQQVHLPAKKRAIMVPGPEKLDFWHFRLLRKEFSVFPYSLPLPNGGRRIPIWHPSQVLKHPTHCLDIGLSVLIFAACNTLLLAVFFRTSHQLVEAEYERSKTIKRRHPVEDSRRG
jgi:hypothetical protein